MEMRKADLQLIRAGFILFTLALLTGLAVPVFANPRMAVAAHLNAMTVLAGALSVVYALRHRAVAERAESVF